MVTLPTVEVHTQQGLMPAYLAVPEKPGPWPRVVVIHDFTGMSAADVWTTSSMRARASSTTTAAPGG
jgi:dienelactone hydrolase